VNSPKVLKAVSDKLKRDYEEVLGASFYQLWIENYSMAWHMNPDVSAENIQRPEIREIFEKLFQETVQELNSRGGYDPEEIKRIFRKMGTNMADPVKKQAFIALVEQLDQETTEARTRLGGEQLKEQLKKFPDQPNLLILMGPAYGPIFGLPALSFPGKVEQIGSAHIDTANQILSAIGVLPRSESRAEARSEADQTLGPEIELIPVAVLKEALDAAVAA